MPTMTERVEQMKLDLGVAERPVRPRKKRVRSDALPEFTRYRDDGCDISESCLDCPLPRCRYEEPGGLRAILNEYRDGQIMQLRRKGATVDELAGRFEVSRRTIFRILGNHGATRRRRRPTPIAALRSDSGQTVPTAYGRGPDVAQTSGQESRVA